MKTYHAFSGASWVNIFDLGLARTLSKHYYMNIEKSCHNFELCNATLAWTHQKPLVWAKYPRKFLKDGAEVLTVPPWNLVNLSIKQSLFPDQCKIAKLKPLFKKCSKSDPKNYRPISLLPVVSKIIEKIIQIQTQEYLWYLVEPHALTLWLPSLFLW